MTRGYGVLEGWLARQRCSMANKLIKDHWRAGRVLDIGCGSHPFFLLHTEFFEKYGIDQVVKTKEKDKFKSDKIKLFHFDIDGKQKMPFPDAHFDVVIMLAVIEHLLPNSLQALVNEIYRMLKKDGVFIYTTPSAKSDRLLQLMSRVGLVSQAEISEHKKYYHRQEIEKILEAAGFARDNMKFGVFELQFNTWGVAKK